MEENDFVFGIAGAEAAKSSSEGSKSQYKTAFWEEKTDHENRNDYFAYCRRTYSLLRFHTSACDQGAAREGTDVEGTGLAFLGKEGKQKRLNGIWIVFYVS